MNKRVFDRLVFCVSTFNCAGTVHGKKFRFVYEDNHECTLSNPMKMQKKSSRFFLTDKKYSPFLQENPKF